MKAFYGYALVLAVIVTSGCALLNQATAAATEVSAAVTLAASMPAATTSSGASVTPAPTGATAEACTQDTLRLYLRQFTMPMAGYEMGLMQVYGITSVSNGSASAAEYNAALGMIQSAHDSVAALQPPSCAQKMQADMLTSMEHMTAAIKIRVNKGSQAQFEAEMTQAKTYQNTAEKEFGDLSAKAGLTAVTATP